jgi:hypothetical protein
MFVTEGSASKVICPHCRAMNVVGAPQQQGNQPPIRRNIVLQERPNYSIYEASSIARQQIQELTSDPYSGWERVSVGLDNVQDCFTKSYCLDKEKSEVFATKATGVFIGDPQVVATVYWSVDQELIWNANTVQSMNILEDLGSQQLVYQQHKTTSAATLKNDVNYRRGRTDQGDGSIWIYSVSEQTSPETKANFRRGWVVFGGLLIEQGNEGYCRVTLVWCWDFGGFIHEKFVTEEKKESGYEAIQIRLSGCGVHAQSTSTKCLPTRYNTTIFRWLLIHFFLLIVSESLSSAC